jgi:hypothetical protein
VLACNPSGSLIDFLFQSLSQESRFLHGTDGESLGSCLQAQLTKAHVFTSKQSRKTSRESMAGKANRSTLVLKPGRLCDSRRSWGVRAQVDLLRTHFFNNTENHGRVAVGLVYRFYP